MTPTEEKASNKLTKDEKSSFLKLAKNISGGQSCVCTGRGEAIIWLIKGFVRSEGRKIYHIYPSETNNTANSNNGEAGIELFDVLTQDGIKNTSINQFETSEEASRKCREKVGLLWINSTDSYENVKKILRAWIPKLAPDAKVAFQGSDLPALARILKEHLGEQGDFTFVESIGTTAVVCVDKCIHHWLIDSHEIGICKICGRIRDFKRIRNGTQSFKSYKKEDLQKPQKVINRKAQPILKKKKITKH